MRASSRSLNAPDGFEARRTDEGAPTHHARAIEANLSSSPDFVYAFDRHRRFAYVNDAMLRLFGLEAEEMLGKTFAELDYPADLARLLGSHIDRIFERGITIEDEMFFLSPSGQSGYFGFRWGPVRNAMGAVELVVGVSRNSGERRALEQALRDSEARLRTASDLVGMGIYSWDPVTDAFEWDDRMRTMWGLPDDAEVDRSVFEAGVHPDDLPRVQRAIATCLDPAGDGRYDVEYRVIGRNDRLTRHIATKGRTTFAHGRAVGFLGAAIDVSERRIPEAAIQASEARFRSFAAHSSNLIWIGDLRSDAVVYRSAAYERIWGTRDRGAPIDFASWVAAVHPDDRRPVENALSAVKSGEVARLEYRIVRPADGAVRWLRETSFPIPDSDGPIWRIGGITEDMTREDVRQVYVFGTNDAEARTLTSVVRSLGRPARMFTSAESLLRIAAALAPGWVIVDLRDRRLEGLSIMRELTARSIALPTIAIDAPDADAAEAVDAMKAGAIDVLIARDDPTLRVALATALAESHGATRVPTHDKDAYVRVARLPPREREVLRGLVDRGTNKSIGRALGISPRTVELHRAQVMTRLNAGSLTELLRIALAAGITPSDHGRRDG